MTDHITVTNAGAVRVIRFTRIEKKNAITRAMYAAMADALDAAGHEPAVKTVVIAGAENCFTAGNDLMDFMEAPPQFGGVEKPPVERFMRALMACPKPVIAAVDGLAVGIGTTLLLHCDLVYASTRASFTAPFVNLALAPEFGSSQLLPGLAGRAAAAELLLMGEKWDAARAEAKGLVTAVLPEAGFEAAVMEKADALAAKAPDAVRTAKALMAAPPESLEARILREGELFTKLLASEEFQEAVTAFLERRPPDFSRFG